jgi:hypothetical protein
MITAEAAGAAEGLPNAPAGAEMVWAETPAANIAGSNAGKMAEDLIGNTSGSPGCSMTHFRFQKDGIFTRTGRAPGAQLTAA